MTSRSFAWIVGLLLAGNLMAQVMFTGAPVFIGFDTTVAGVNNGQFAGSGFTATPAVGQLDSGAWAVTGPSDGDLLFGESATTGDYARGPSVGHKSQGGFYAFKVGGALGVALGFQATGDDFTPGTITLKVQNTSGAILNYLRVAYDIYCFNDQGRSTTLKFSYSTDNSNYPPVSALDFASPPTKDSSPAWQSSSWTMTLSGLAVAASDDLYLRWSTDDNAADPGSGYRDELALDNITLLVPEPVDGTCCMATGLLGLAIVAQGRRRRQRRGRAV